MGPLPPTSIKINQYATCTGFIQGDHCRDIETRRYWENAQPHNLDLNDYVVSPHKYQTLLYAGASLIVSAVLWGVIAMVIFGGGGQNMDWLMSP